jgi:hypothetical protein
MKRGRYFNKSSNSAGALGVEEFFPNYFCEFGHTLFCGLSQTQKFKKTGGQYYETYYRRNLHSFVISYSVCPSQAFQA